MHNPWKIKVAVYDEDGDVVPAISTAVLLGFEDKPVEEPTTLPSNWIYLGHQVYELNEVAPVILPTSPALPTPGNTLKLGKEMKEIPIPPSQQLHPSEFHSQEEFASVQSAMELLEEHSNVLRELSDQNLRDRIAHFVEERIDGRISEEVFYWRMARYSIEVNRRARA